MPPRERRAVKGVRWLLLENRDNLPTGQDVALDELLAANHNLFVVIPFCATPWISGSSVTPEQAARAWCSWYR